MPISRTTTVSTMVQLGEMELAVEAIPLVNNMFRLTRATYWTFTTDWIPEQKHLQHRRLHKEEREIILEAIVKEWNNYAREDDPFEGKRELNECCLVLNDDYKLVVDRLKPTD